MVCHVKALKLHASSIDLFQLTVPCPLHQVRVEARMRSRRSAASRHTPACRSDMCLNSSGSPATRASTGLTCRSSDRKTLNLQRLNPRQPPHTPQHLPACTSLLAASKLTSVCQAGATPAAAATMRNTACVTAARCSPSRLASSCQPWLGTGCKAGAEQEHVSAMS